MSAIQLHTALDLDAPIEAAWALLGEGFADWDQWAPGIDRSTLAGPLEVGVIRTNETPSLGTVEQELVRFVPAEHALAYEIRAGLPPMFARVRNDWWLVEGEDGRCRLEGEAIFELKPPAEAMQAQIEGKMRHVIDAFAVAVRDALVEQ